MYLKFSYTSLLAGTFLFSCQSQKPMVVQGEEQHQSPLPKKEEVQVPDLLELVRSKEAEIADYRAAEERKFDLLHTDLEISFDYSKKLVYGNAMLTLKPYFYPQRDLVLDAKGFDLHQINLVEDGQEQPLGIRYNGKRLIAYLPKYYNKHDTLVVRVKYTAHPSESSEKGSKAITDTQGLYFINPDGCENKPTQIWTQGETEHNSKWFPTIDAPNERATSSIWVTVDDKYTTVSNGKLMNQVRNEDGTRTDHWLMDMSHAPYLMALAVGEFAKVKDRWNGKPVNYYVEEKYREGAARVFQNTPEMMTYFSDLLGVPFPWQKYDQIVVRDFVSGAMENTTASIFMEELNMSVREAVDNEYEGIIAHELFHQWFGDYVTTESWSNLPLNEAFATYGEYLWYEHKEGRDVADLHNQGELEAYFWESEEKQVDLIRFDYEDNEDMFDSHSYAKGGRVLHMLRDVLGDKAFFQGLNNYLKKHAFKSVEIHDLRLALEETSGRDLNWFFNQWFMASGHPVLDVKFDYSQPRNILLTVSQQQDLSRMPLYVIPFEVSWYVDGKRYSKRFVLDRAYQQFALENEDAVTQAYFDESKILLAKKNVTQSTEQLLEQFYTSDFGVCRYEALDSLAGRQLNEKQVEKLIDAGLEDEFWPIREVSLNRFSQYFSTGGKDAKILEMADLDDNNNVRASAIECLADVGEGDFTNDYLRWMEDSSFYVAGSALNAYLNSSTVGIDKEIIAKEFEREESIRILVPIVDYYTRKQIGGKGGWLHQKFENMQGQNLYYLIGYYGDYFARMPEEGSEEAIEKLSKVARDHRVSYVRLAAFQALFGFIDKEGVQEKLEAIYEQEEDEDVKRGEEYFLLPNFNEN